MVRDVVHKVELTTNNIDVMLLMTKDPTPMIPLLDEIRDMGIRVGFHVTVTPYGTDIEPGVPNKADVTESFRRISDIIGKESIVWRYDPVMISDKHSVSYHKRKFKAICNELSGYTERCIFSTVDIYDKLRTVHEMEEVRPPSKEELDEIARCMGEVAADNGIEVSNCCSKHDLSKYGITSRGCIDKEFMRSLNIPFDDTPANLKDGCTCIRNIDIGEYDTCYHNCIYCYANRNTDSSRNRKEYDPMGEMLHGKLRDIDRVVELSSRKVSKITDF